MLAAVLVTGLLVWSRGAGGGGDRPVDAPGRPFAAPSGAGVAAPAAPVPLPEGGFDEIRGELERRARAGDAEAAYRLGHVMATCRGYRPLGNGVFQDLLVSGADTLRGMLRIGGKALEEQAMLEMFVHGKALLERTCAGAAGLATTTARGDAHPWMQRAAMLGHPRAMAEYADVAFDEYTTIGALLDNAAEVARRRDLAQRLLDGALASGEPAALVAAAKWHGAGGGGRRDPVLALGYWLAWRATDDGGPKPEALLRTGDDVYSEGLSPDEMRRAERLASRIERDRGVPP